MWLLSFAILLLKLEFVKLTNFIATFIYVVRNLLLISRISCHTAKAFKVLIYTKQIYHEIRLKNIYTLVIS